MKKIFKSIILSVIISTVISLHFIYADTKSVITRSSSETEFTKKNIEYSVIVGKILQKPEYLIHYVQENQLYIEGKTKLSLPYIMIIIESINGSVILEEIFENKSSFIQELPKPTDGTYKISLYQGEERYGTYRCTMTEYLQIRDGNRLYYYDSSVRINNSSFFYTPKNPKNHLKTIKNKSISLVSSELATSCTSDYERALRIHDYIASEIYYDMDAYNSNLYSESHYKGEKVFTSKRAICSGYSDLYCIMLNAIGIPCRKVSGIALNTENFDMGYAWKKFSESNHSWNEVYLRDEKRWIIVDVTWDSGNRFINGKYEKQSVTYKYFDPTLESFSYDHKIMELE